MSQFTHIDQENKVEKLKYFHNKYFSDSENQQQAESRAKSVWEQEELIENERKWNYYFDKYHKSVLEMADWIKSKLSFYA